MSPFLEEGQLFFALEPQKARVADINEKLIHFYQDLVDNYDITKQELKQCLIFEQLIFDYTEATRLLSSFLATARLTIEEALCASSFMSPLWARNIIIFYILYFLLLDGVALQKGWSNFVSLIVSWKQRKRSRKRNDETRKKTI